MEEIYLMISERRLVLAVALVALAAVGCGNRIWNRPMFKPEGRSSEDARAINKRGRLPAVTHTFRPKGAGGTVKISIAYMGQRIPNTPYAPGHVMLTLKVFVENNTSKQFRVPLSTASVVTSGRKQYDADWKNNVFGETNLRPGTSENWTLFFDTQDPNLIKGISSFTFYLDFFVNYDEIIIKERFDRIRWPDEYGL